MPSRFAFLNRPTRLEAWVLQKLTGVETHCHAQMRGVSFPQRLFAVSLLPVSALAACTALLVSQASSFEVTATTTTTITVTNTITTIATATTTVGG
jgi:hypothetical protein